MSITVKIKTNNNRVKQLQQVHKAEKQAIYQVELRNRWERYVLLRVFTYLVDLYGSNRQHNTWRILPPNYSACFINILMSKHSFLSTIRLFRHLHRSSVYSSVAVWYIPLKETTCQTKCSKDCWCWRQMPTCVHEHKCADYYMYCTDSWGAVATAYYLNFLLK